MSYRYAPLAPSGATHAPRHVTIVMATLNGGSMIDAQLESLAAQDHADWSLIVSDDGSTDDTLDRVAAFAARHPERRIVRLRGPGKGSAMNFLSLLRAAGATPYLAFADQDDVWLPDRLSRGLKALDDCRGPAAWGSRTLITGRDLSRARPSKVHRRPTGFANALVQNVSGGNTMLLNRPLLDLLQPASRAVNDLVAHDWWVYQAVTAIGGRMIHDPLPSLLYRQHAGNQIGANDTAAGQAHRLGSLFLGRFGRWLDIQIAALAPLSEAMTPDARRRADGVARLRAPGLRDRLAALRETGLYRQSRRETVALILAVMCRRV